MMTTVKRPKEVPHDESPSQIVDHAFEPKFEWWSLCKHCNFSEAAHKETTLQPLKYHSDDEEAFA